MKRACGTHMKRVPVTLRKGAERMPGTLIGTWSLKKSTVIRLGGYRYTGQSFCIPQLLMLINRARAQRSYFCLDCLKVCRSYAKASRCHTRVLHQSTRGRIHRTGDHTSCIYPRITCARVTSRERWVSNLKDDTWYAHAIIATKRRYVCIISSSELWRQVVNFKYYWSPTSHPQHGYPRKSASSKYAPVSWPAHGSLERSRRSLRVVFRILGMNILIIDPSNMTAPPRGHASSCPICCGALFEMPLLEILNGPCTCCLTARSLILVSDILNLFSWYFWRTLLMTIGNLTCTLTQRRAA